jgi:hypothetical protein
MPQQGNLIRHPVRDHLRNPLICMPVRIWPCGRLTLKSADVSEFRLRILMQRPASPFVISYAVRGKAEHSYPALRMGLPIRSCWNC